MGREEIKLMIELSNDVDEADEIIEGQGYTQTNEKLAFLHGMFDCAAILRKSDPLINKEESLLMDYYAILTAIINSKWED